ncbi:capsular polysaccharide synthesis protein [uncultured Draconibacterium sp.]|uniref:capsular polysaccharide synthesis protein n=1 Tax=uncultured Draconibacterium sp. TaxID=1573823 RepID=UPI002AA7D4C4|nr:capsular polysaccharide synthesis protein [uncultured Draconibacterium sp.]
MRKLLLLLKRKDYRSNIANFIKAGLFITPSLQILLLGISKKALEILRLSTQLKIQKKLSKKYSHILQNPPELTKDKKESNKVWICWLQGIENAPKLVQVCYKSVVRNLSDKEVIVVTKDNYSRYTKLPKHILNKWEKGTISNTHFSDILRIELLVRHGGLWLDSTVLCTNSTVPKYIEQSDLFLYQVLKPGLDGHSIYVSSWLIKANSNNKVLGLTRELLFDYWKKKNRLVDYFLLHHFLCISLNTFQDQKNKIPKFPNSIPHILLLQLFDNFDSQKYQHIQHLTPFHKLSYKRDTNELAIKNTFYDILINQERY